jgi:UrcA family protein
MNKLSAVDTSARAHSISKHVACIAAVAASLAMFSMSASAQIVPPRKTVDFYDLDLTKDQDTQRLYRRLRAAASEVCAQFSDYKGAVMRVRKARCMDNALNGAVETIGNASLTALHTKRTEEKLAQSKPKSAPAG